jgi:integrase
MNQRYQKGSIRRQRRASGQDVWVWRYRVSGVMKQEMFRISDFPTERALWKHLETPISLLNSGSEEPVPVAVTMGKLIERYRKEYLPELAKSTRDTDGSMLKVHIEPRWAHVSVTDVRAMDVDKWLRSLPISPPSKGRARRLMKQLIDKAMFWELIPHRPNPITLVKVKGATKREKEIILLTPTQVGMLMAELAQPFRTMVLVAAILGLRVEEIVALQWADFNFRTGVVRIRRAFTHGELGQTKSDASAAKLPVPDVLSKALLAYRPMAGQSEWLFPSPVTGGPRRAEMIVQDYLKPTAAKLGLPKIGWHTFRHSYRAWLGASEATLSQQKDLMRHADIATTTGYGGTPVEDMRPFVDAVAAKFGEVTPVPSPTSTA